MVRDKEITRLLYSSQRPMNGEFELWQSLHHMVKHPVQMWGAGPLQLCICRFPFSHDFYKYKVLLFASPNDGTGGVGGVEKARGQTDLHRKELGGDRKEKGGKGGIGSCWVK